MARQSRFVRAGLAHHVMQGAHNRQPLALDDADRQAWLDTLREVTATHSVALHGWVLLPDRFHLLATPPTDDALSLMMQSLGRRYVAAFNRRHGRRGTLWDGRFRASLLEPGPTCLACLCLMETLPARLGLVESASDWRWSSLQQHLGHPSGGWVIRLPEFWALGNTPFEREMAWRLCVEAGVDEAQAQRLLLPLRSGRPTGSLAFLQSLQEKSEQSLIPRPRGRPRSVRPKAA